MKLRVTALASVLPIGLTLAIQAAPSTVALQPLDRAATSSFTGDASLIRGHGELAVISKDQRLYLLGGRAHGLQKVAIGGRASLPVWSHDGRWLAVTVRPAPTNPSTDLPTTVWLVTRAGKVVRRLTPVGQDVYHAAVAWSPRADKLAIEYTAGVGSAAGPTQRLDVVDVSGKATSLASAQNISGFAWAPNGRRLAVGLNHFDTTSAKWRSRIVTLTPNGSARRTVSTDLGDILDIAGWWPDASGVLAWRDFHGSGSLAADGLPLLDVAVTSGRRHRLTTTMLQYPGWLATSKVRNEVAFIAGGDRELTNGHKHLVICSRKHCRAVPQPKHKVTFDPAWSLDGRLAAVRDHAVPPTAANGAYGLAFTKKVDDGGGIYLVRDRRVHPLAGGSRGTAPVWGKRGSMLFVRGSSLWLLRAAATKAHRVAGPLDSSDSFYGFVSWWDSFAWTGAAADNGRLGTPEVI